VLPTPKLQEAFLPRFKNPFSRDKKTGMLRRATSNMGLLVTPGAKAQTSLNQMSVQISNLLEITPQDHPIRKQLQDSIGNLQSALHTWKTTFEISTDNGFTDPTPSSSQDQVVYTNDHFPEVEFDKVPMKATVMAHIHRELGKGHAFGRPLGDDHPINLDAALFHYRCAADRGLVLAQLIMSNLYSNSPRSELVDLEVDQNLTLSYHYAKLAAVRGNRVGMIKVARFLQFNNDIIEEENRLSEAVKYYELAIETEPDDSCGSYELNFLNYELYAAIAELYKKGGDGLEQNYEKASEYYKQAAEEAIGAMKGRIATTYFNLAEELDAMIE